jgi:hypothetical protein
MWPINNKYLILPGTILAAFAGPLFGLAAAVAAPLPTNSASPLTILPQPRHVEHAGTTFNARAARLIRVTDSEQGRFAASLLQKAMGEALGKTIPIAPLMNDLAGLHELVLGRGARFALPASPPEVEAGKEEEGYGLRVDAHGVRITARSEAGLFYGVQTLIQLIEQAGREKKPIPGLSINDWPEFDLRGICIEGGQSKNSVIVNRANLEHTIRKAARYKMNCLELEIYNLAPFASFPHCADADTLSRSDWEELVELARRHHVTIVPTLQSFGQMAEVIWNCDQGKPYRESTVPGLLCPSRPENIKFLQGLYTDLLRVFHTSPYLGIGCSEVWMQWNKKYCPLCQARINAGETEWDIYCKHVANCAEAVIGAAKELSRPVRPLMWADEFYMYNLRPRYAGLEKMPRQLVMGHWQYFDKYWVLDNYHYDGIEGLSSRGFDVLFVSACWPFNSYLVDLSPAEPTVAEGKFTLLTSSGVLNITDQARWAQAYKDKGHPGKVLGGICATFSQHDIRCWDTTWLGYALHADYTWGDPARPWVSRKNGFLHDFAASFYGPHNDQAVQTIALAYAELDAAKSDLERNNYIIRDMVGEYDMADEAYLTNSLQHACSRIRDLMINPPKSGETVADIRARAEKAVATARLHRRRLTVLTTQVGNPQSLGYLITAAHKIQNHAERTLYLSDQEEVLARPTRQRAIKALQTRLVLLTADTQGLIAEMRKLTWFRDDYATGYYKVISMLNWCQQRLDEALRAVEVEPGGLVPRSEQQPPRQ